jgi:glutathione S-transferase
MSFEYVSTAEAIARDGLRMVVLGKVASPWGEAAKGIFHVKRLDFAAVRLAYDDAALLEWAGQSSAPVVLFDREPPRSGWAEILMLAERLAPHPALLPADPALRARAVQLSEQFCGPGGLGWTRRLQVVHAGLHGEGFPPRVAKYLARKYGYDEASAEMCGPRVRELLAQFAAALRAQRDAGHSWYLGAQFSAVDIYSATFTGMLRPLPEALCAMDPALRAGFEWLDDATAAAIDPVLVEHRDLVYGQYLELPLSL